MNIQEVTGRLAAALYRCVDEFEITPIAATDDRPAKIRIRTRRPLTTVIQADLRKLVPEEFGEVIFQ